MVKVIKCKICDSPCIFPFYGGEYPKQCPYGNEPDGCEYVEEEVELKEIIKNFTEFEQTY